MSGGPPPGPAVHRAALPARHAAPAGRLQQRGGRGRRQHAQPGPADGSQLRRQGGARAGAGAGGRAGSLRTPGRAPRPAPRAPLRPARRPCPRPRALAEALAAGRAGAVASAGDGGAGGREWRARSRAPPGAAPKAGGPLTCGFPRFPGTAGRRESRALGAGRTGSRGPPRRTARARPAGSPAEVCCAPGSRLARTPADPSRGDGLAVAPVWGLRTGQLRQRPGLWLMEREPPPFDLLCAEGGS
ncbi:hypothetical protein VULLAG_LOCUS2524 [Vulpes lagopus]